MLCATINGFSAFVVHEDAIVAIVKMLGAINDDVRKAASELLKKFALKGRLFFGF